MADAALAFADFKPGLAFPPNRYRISLADSQAFNATVLHEPVVDAAGHALGESIEDAPSGAVHPTLVGSFQPQHAAFSWPAGVVHARERIHTFLPVMPDEDLESTVSVLDCSERNGRQFVVLQIRVDKVDAGATAMTVERTLVWPK